MIKLKAFSIFDSKVESYHPPFYARTVGEGLRTWEAMANDEGSNIKRWPGDYTLFLVGEYDQKSGQLIPADSFTNLGLAIEQQKSNSDSMLRSV